MNQPIHDFHAQNKIKKKSLIFSGTLLSSRKDYTLWWSHGKLRENNSRKMEPGSYSRSQVGDLLPIYEVNVKLVGSSKSLTMGGRVFRCIHQDRPHLLPAFIIRKHPRERTHQRSKHLKRYLVCIDTLYDPFYRTTLRIVWQIFV